jgi:predicted anti-sigma-YlaC factor YlaD
MGDDLVAPLMHLADAFIADKKLVVRSWVREHGLHLVTPLAADGTAAGVVWSNRSGFGTAMGDKLKLLAEPVLARDRLVQRKPRKAPTTDIR